MSKQEILQKTQDSIWIVKASEVIMGPYKIAELAQAVRSKSIGLLDEAKKPGGRWGFVRDIPEIQATISKLAEVEDTFEKTHSAAHTQLTATYTINDENTPVPPQIPLVQTPVSPTPSANPQPVTTSTSGGAASEATPVKTYSVNPPAQKIPWIKWGMIAFIAVTVVVALASFVQKKTWESDQKKIWAEFQQYYVAQLYNDAYKKIKEFQREYPDQPTALTRAAYLFLNPGKELVNARRLFDRSSQLDPNNKELMVQNLNGLGLISMYESQWSQSKSYFDRALTLEPNNIFVRINMISLAMAQGQFTDAYTISQQIVAADPKKAFLIQAALSILSPTHHEHGKNLIASLEKTIDGSSYLRQVQRLMMIKLMSLHNNFEGMDIQLKNFFEDLPSLQLEFSETPVLDQRWKDWNFLFQFCNDIKGPASLDADISALRVVCVSQIGKWNEAEKMLSEAQMRFPNNPRLFKAQLHMLTSMERWPNVRSVMQTASLTTDTSTNWMFALACFQEHNKSCMDLYLSPLLKKSVVPTAVYDLQARSTCVEGKVSELCRSAITQGLTQDPIATNLLKLRLQIEAGL